MMPPSISSPHSDTEQEEGKALHLMIKHYSGGVMTPWVTAVPVGK